MNSKVVSDTMACAVPVVQAHLPQGPASQHLHVYTYGFKKQKSKHNKCSVQVKHPAPVTSVHPFTKGEEEEGSLVVIKGKISGEFL